MSPNHVSASSGLHGLCKDIKVFIRGSMTFAMPSRFSSGVSSLHGIIHQERGFMVFFNHLNHMIQHDITCGVAWFLLGDHDTIGA